MSAIPNNYEMPVSESGRYTKIEDGQSVKLRVLAEITTGWQYFNTENKPVRSREAFKETPTDISEGKYGKQAPKHFWVVTVYNHSTKQVELWNVTQVGIQKALLALEKNPDWGNLLDYDITVTRTKTGDKIEYQVVPNKPKDLDEEAFNVISSMSNIDLDAYFKSENPFKD